MPKVFTRNLTSIDQLLLLSDAVDVDDIINSGIDQRLNFYRKKYVPIATKLIMDGELEMPDVFDEDSVLIALFKSKHFDIADETSEDKDKAQAAKARRAAIVSNL